MNRPFQLLSSLIFLQTLYTGAAAQSSLSGRINFFSAVQHIDYCASVLTADSASLFKAGTTAILIQMDGAAVSTGRNDNFGSIQDLRSAGLFELVKIDSVNGSDLYLKHQLVHQYDENAHIQLVNLPEYQSAVVADTLTTRNWNGNTGGVLALQVQNRLELKAPIIGSGLGFRGGAAASPSGNSCNWLVANDAYVYGRNNWRGALKGEGIATFPAGNEAGRGAWSNGGGGGNDHNSGGGGGSNTGAGGMGGRNNEPANFGCKGRFPGLGGFALGDEKIRLFMGGGGGAGHGNNNNAGTGGNGGGIVIILAGAITGNKAGIFTNGQDGLPLVAPGDGGAGGGGGGSILIWSSSVPETLEAKGGSGSDVDNQNQERCFGPGGGGGGGAIWVKKRPQLPSGNVNGGKAGLSMKSRSCGVGSNGATNGQNGQLQALERLPEGQAAPGADLPPPASGLACTEKPMKIFVPVILGAGTVQWQIDRGTGFTDIKDTGLFSGSDTDTLEIRNISGLSGFKIRYQFTSQCYGVNGSLAITLKETQAPVAAFRPLINRQQVNFTNLSRDATHYIWDFGDGDTSTITSPVHGYAAEGRYIVTLMAGNGCGTDTVRMALEIIALPQAAFSAADRVGCTPLTTRFSSNATGTVDKIQWVFPGGSPASSLQPNPVVTYTRSGVYDVTLIVSNEAGSDTLMLSDYIQVNPKPEPDWTVTISGKTADFVYTGTTVPGMTINWDFGDGSTASGPQASHPYDKTGTYMVILTVLSDCGEEELKRTIRIGSPPQAAFKASSTTGCTPKTITFTDQSSGEPAKYYWSFPGGTPDTSNLAVPEITYTSSGTFDVRLTVENEAGSHTILLEDYIRLADRPVADFDFRVKGDTVVFTNYSEDADRYTWTFGDGNRSSVEEPVHVYGKSGTYLVTLNALNAYCGSSSTLSVSVFTTGIEDLQAAGFKVYPNPLRDKLNIISSGSEPVQCRIFDQWGREVLRSGQPILQRFELDCSALPPGVYYLQMESSRQVWTAPLVKM